MDLVVMDLGFKLMILRLVWYLHLELVTYKKFGLHFSWFVKKEKDFFDIFLDLFQNPKRAGAKLKIDSNSASKNT